LAALLLALGWWLYLEHVDPRYNGRRTSEWLLALNSENEEEVEQAELAIFILGKRALPQITKFFYTPESEWKEAFFEWVEEKTGWELEWHEPSDLRNAGENAIEILGKRAAPMIPQLIQSLKDDEFGYDSQYALETIGDAAIAPLKLALNDSNSDVRFEAVCLLFPGKHADILPKLRGFQAGDHSELRAISILAIAYIDPVSNETEALVRSSIKDRHEIVREYAAEALGFLAQNKHELIPELFLLAHDPSARVRYRVAHWCHAFCSKDSVALDALVALVSDSDIDVQKTALRSLCSTLEAELLGPRFLSGIGPFRIKDHQAFHLPYTAPEVKPGLVFARSHEILPLILRLIRKPLAPKPFHQIDEVHFSAVTVMLLLDPRFRPHVQDVLFEMKTQSRFVNNEADWQPIANATIPDESWVKISNQLDSLKQFDPEVAKLVHSRVLTRIQPPPTALTNLYKP